MPSLLSTLLGGLITIAGSMAGRIAVALGFSLITYTGVSASLGWLKTQSIAAAMGLGPEIVGMLATMKVGQCINIVFSATVARLLLDGLNGDTVKRWVTK